MGDHVGGNVSWVHAGGQVELGLESGAEGGGILGVAVERIDSTKNTGCEGGIPVPY